MQGDPIQKPIEFPNHTIHGNQENSSAHNLLTMRPYKPGMKLYDPFAVLKC